MQENEKEIIFEALRRLAVIKRIEPTPEMIQLYCENLSKYSVSEILTALKNLLEQFPKFPDISQIIKEIKPPLTEKDHGEEIAAKIFQALKTYGPHRSIEACKHLGEDIWNIVEGMNGWHTLNCLTYDQLGIARAQIRNLATTRVKVDKVKKSSDLKKLDFDLKNLIN